MAGRKKHLYLYKGEYHDVNYIAKDMGAHVTTVRQRIYYGTPLSIPKAKTTERLVFDEKEWLEPVISK